MRADAHGDTNRPRLDRAGTRHLQTLWTLGAVGGMSDADLLARFIAGTTRSGAADAAELAFAALVDRHGGTVLRVARMVLGEESASLDASQATFLLLARKARRLHVGDSLAPWLASVARRVALGVRKAEARRRRHESAAAAARTESTGPSPPEVWPETIRAVLAEVDRLPEPYRAAVVACHLDGLSQHAAADRLGWPLGTLQSRLDRGRRRLRDRLTRRGLAPSILGLIPSQGLTVTFPIRLTTPLARAAVAWVIQANPTSLSLAPGVVAILQPTLKGAVVLKLTAAAFTLTTALGIAATGFGPRLGSGGDTPGPATRPDTTVSPRAENVTLDGSKHLAPADDQITPGPGQTPASAATSPPRLICFMDESGLPLGAGLDLDQLITKKYPLAVTIFKTDKIIEQRYQITKCPTFIVADGAGQELARREWISSTRQVAELLNDYSPLPYPEITHPSDELPPPAQGSGPTAVLCMVDEATEKRHPIDYIFGTLRAKGYAISYLRIEQVPDLAAKYHVQSTTSIMIDEVGNEIARTSVEPGIGSLAAFFNRHRPITPPESDQERRLLDQERKLDRVLESLDNIRGQIERETRNQHSLRFADDQRK